MLANTGLLKMEPPPEVLVPAHASLLVSRAYAMPRSWFLVPAQCLAPEVLVSASCRELISAAGAVGAADGSQKA